MNTFGNVSASMTIDSLNKVKEAIQTIATEMPFLINLSEEQARGLFRLGPKSVDFVTASRETVTHFPQILPPTFDQVEFLKDAELFGQLSEIKFLLDSLCEKVEDTYGEVGAEAMNSALEVYAHVRVNENKVPGLKSVSEKLGERFKKSKSAKAEKAV